MDAICLIESSSSANEEEEDDHEDDDIPITIDENEKQRTRRDNEDDETPYTRTSGVGKVDVDRDQARDRDRDATNITIRKRPRLDCSFDDDETTRRRGRGSISIVSQKTGKIVVSGSSRRDDLALQQQQRQQQAQVQAVSLSSMFSRSVPHRRGYWSGHVKIPLLFLHKAVKLPQAAATKSSSHDKIISGNDKGGGTVNRSGDEYHTTSSSSSGSDGSTSEDDYSTQQLSLMKKISRRVRKSTINFKTWLEDRGHTGYIMEHDDPSHLHISFSKYFSISIANIEPFMKQLESLIRDAKLTRTRITVSCGGDVGSCSSSSSNSAVNSTDRDSGNNSRFDNTNKRSPTILVNDERTRSFWCWGATTTRNNETLVRLVNLVDTILRRYNQPTYYQPPTFHVSIASFAGDLTDEILQQKTNGSHTNDEKKDHAETGSSSSQQIYRDEVKRTDNDEGDYDDDDDDDDEDSIVVTVDRIVCTFGTTKEFVINLL